MPSVIHRTLLITLCVFAIAFGASVTCASSGAWSSPPPGDAPRLKAGEYAVERIIDGDTIVVEGGVTVRYIGVDTPEAGEPLYNAAKARNAGLLSSGRVVLEPCAEEPRDRYGRLLAWVYSDGVFVGGRLVEEGLARRLIIPPCGSKKAAELAGLEQSARDAGAGLWAEGGARRGEIVWGARSGVETIETREAAQYIGKYVRVRGRVSATHRGPSGLYIHFHTGGPLGFSAVILAKSFKGFPPELLDPKAYEGRTVIVTGVITEFVIRTEIVVSAPTDIEIK